MAENTSLGDSRSNVDGGRHIALPPGGPAVCG